MKRTISLWIGLLAFAVMPALAQTPAPAPANGQTAGQPTGKIHGKITNPTGAPQSGGTVSLNQGTKEIVSFPVDANGDYSGSAAPGTYTLVYRTPGMPPDKDADKIDNIKIVAGQDTAADDDMSREEYVKTLPEETRKQLEEMKKHNSEALKANAVIKNLNADLKTVTGDIHDADTAHAAAVQQLGASASKTDVAAKENEIRTAKYTDVVTLMSKDTQLRPQESVLWAYLGQGQMGLKKYDEAETSYKKALELDAASKKPRPDIQGLVNAGLGEIYARTNKADQAQAAYDAAAKADPTKAAFYYKNEAVIFSQAGNTDGQAAAADKAIAANAQDPIPYYLKGQALISKATVDPKTSRIVLPPGCGEAYQKYLELDPTGPYSADVKGILDSAGQKVNSTYKAGKK
ncbi:MAG TPA: carboxypeptidase regulatory-like domain-containing protein [Terracidiphilus sp.]|nr:carboxypeptidase regulatory-like domain-containing protein [Terracidiphilus sp.]